MGSRWRSDEDRLTDYDYRPAHTDRRSLQAEQDAAAGYGRRHLTLADGSTATARVKLVRKKRARRVYAVMIWDHGSSRTELTLGEVRSTSRTSNLRHAWAYIHAHDLLTATGRDTWTALARENRPPIET